MGYYHKFKTRFYDLRGKETLNNIIKNQDILRDKWELINNDSLSSKLIKIKNLEYYHRPVAVIENVLFRLKTQTNDKNRKKYIDSLLNNLYRDSKFKLPEDIYQMTLADIKYAQNRSKTRGTIPNSQFFKDKNPALAKRYRTVEGRARKYRKKELVKDVLSEIRDKKNKERQN